MRIIAVPNIPQFHTTPLVEIRVKDLSIVVELDDSSEKRFGLVFQPYQAMRLTTADCFVLPKGLAILAHTVMEVSGSSWIEELKAKLKLVDETAKFLENAKHFILPLQDDFLELVASKWSFSPLGKT